MQQGFTLSTLHLHLQLQPSLTTSSCSIVQSRLGAQVNSMEWVVVCHPDLQLQQFLHTLSDCITATSTFALQVSQHVHLHEMWCVQVHPGGSCSPCSPVSVIPRHQRQLRQLSVLQVHSYHPVSMEPIALPQAYFHQLHHYRDIGELLLEPHPAAARSIFQLCYFTSRLWCSCLHTIHEYQSCVGESLRVLTLFSDAKIWLWDAYHGMSVILDPADDDLRNCMISLGTLCVATKELSQARALLERVALLDELEEGPTALVTLETLLHVATVYRFECKYNSALSTVQLIVDTLENIRWEPERCELLCKCWTTLGVLHVSMGDVELGCMFFERAFLWRLAHNGPSSKQTWTILAKWFWLMIYANSWTYEKSKLISWSQQMPLYIEDWPGKKCAGCRGAIYGTAFSNAEDAPYSYLYCRRCVDLESDSFQQCPCIRDFTKSMH